MEKVYLGHRTLGMRSGVCRRVDTITSNYPVVSALHIYIYTGFRLVADLLHI